jgi:hypothetical protein
MTSLLFHVSLNDSAELIVAKIARAPHLVVR